MEVLRIAEGTPWEIGVYDVRQGEAWTAHSGYRGNHPPEAIFIHHTATTPGPTGALAQLNAMKQLVPTLRYGLPYNFIIFPGAKRRIWYLNDVDWCWPHTYANNCAVSICAWGNFEVEPVPGRLAYRIERLARALMAMWGRELPVHGHRDVFATACPGSRLYGALVQRGLISKPK